MDDDISLDAAEEEDDEDEDEEDDIAARLFVLCGALTALPLLEEAVLAVSPV